MTTTTLVHSRKQVEGFKFGKAQAEAGQAPLYTYPADIDLYAHDDFVAGYVDGYESVANPV